MGLSWEEMCQKVVIDGRPGDVESAALGWEQLIKNLNNVKQSLDTNIKDLGTTWKGPAYEAFKGHVEQIAKDTGQLVADAEKGTGIVQSLKAAADRLTAAQRDFPIPATCVNDVLEARNAKLTLSVGFFEAKVSPDFLGWLDPVSAIADWINDQSKDAADVFERVSGEYQAIAPGTPGTGGPITAGDPTRQIPNLDTGGGGGGGVGGVPNIGGGNPSAGAGIKPSISGLDTGNPPGGSGVHPALTSEYDPGTGGYPGTGGVPGTGGLDEEFSSGLAGAGGAGVPGLGSGGGGLGSAGGLGSGGGGGGLGSAGSGVGALAGGGALGRPVTPGMGPMMGGGAAGAGRGGGRGAGGRLGAGGKLGGGMAPGMGGVAAGGAGAGRGGAGRGAGGAGAAGRGAGARGAGGMAGMGGGAGYGEEEAPRDTWLEEDEDVWGADGGGTSGVLR
ncbi:WXG100 family type VII secretion target [Micromonospora sp. NPDC000316]|uniref:WXG100 family type VII secretion target n=1 Tax=Micromonospora sp. NPDC000316 TaxID=3364216 RepID=UPI003680AC33